MIENASSFTWRRPGQTGGFEWVDFVFEEGKAAPEKPGPVLAVVGPAEAYRPVVDETGLFLTFAETEPTANGVQAFANRFGALSLDNDTLDAWSRAILTFRYGWMVCQLVREHDTASLQHLIRGNKDSVRLVAANEKDEVVIVTVHRADIPAQRWATFVDGKFNVENLALFLVMRALDPRPMATRLALDFESGMPMLQVEPVDLRGVMALQMMDAVAANKKYQQCPACGRWFEFRPDINRTNKIACSLSCRKKLYYARTVRAREMAAEGRTPKQIAKELGSDVDTVKGWLAKGEK